ncbi:MAG: alanine--tRNA ligase [Thermoplasmata archaeon]|nr:alanine--tRNA ligase [Thermoplasmata archaeon]
MDPSEYDLAFFHREGFQRRTCTECGSAFWTLGDHTRCQEAPCAPYAFIGHPGFRRSYSMHEMREAYLGYFEHRGHTRIGRYPTVARWRNDVFFTQASIYDFQPWVTSGAIPPPANPLTISQPCLRFIDIDDVGVSGRHFTEFEMMAHHAFNRPDHEVYFKDRCVELCHGLLGELGADPRAITYKEETWEGGGNLGPSLSVGLAGLELATLVFMEYVRDANGIRPMPMTVVDTGYGLERFVWMSHGTKTAYEPVFGAPYEELRRTLAPREAAIVIDHARTLSYMLTDGVVPSNSKEGYFARLLIRRGLRVLARVPEAPDLISVIERVAREVAHDYPEVGAHRDDRDRLLTAEIERYGEALERARPMLRRQEERAVASGGRITEENLVEWYDSLGVPPEVAVTLISNPPVVPTDFYSKVASRHEQETPTGDYVEHSESLPEIPAAIAATEVLYYLDPYTLSFDAHVLWTAGPFVVLDRTYFYPTGGGQVHDTGHLGEIAVTDVLRKGPWVLHRLDAPIPFRVGDRIHGTIDRARRVQLMQHHTATHLLNGALRETLGPHVWQAGAYKGTEAARIDITHYRPLTRDELRRVERRVNEIVREDRPVKSYFESRNEAERRFGFTLYQGGAVPGKELRIVDIGDFDVEACGGTHCTHTSEVGAVALLGVERIQDGIVRLTYASGERALDLRDEHEEVLREAARRLHVPLEKIPEGIDRLLSEVEASRRAEKGRRGDDLRAVADRLSTDPGNSETAGSRTIVHARIDLDRNELMELSRLLTRLPGRVALLASEREDKGTLFVGSSDPMVAADALLRLALPIFEGRGGGNRSAATAVGEPGAPLEAALEAARRGARDAASTAQ